MDNTSPVDGKNSGDSPKPEVLVPRADDGSMPAEEASSTSLAETPSAAGASPRRHIYRPSHRGTFIGLGVVVVVLGINAGVITFILRHQAGINHNASQGQVTISQSVLNGLGVNRSGSGDSGILLTVGPDAKFNGKLTVGGDVTVAGQFKLNSTFSAASANLTQLQAGNTALSELNVNGTATATALNLRNDLLVNGTTRLQGPVTLSQLLTVNNSVNIATNLTIGGVLTVNSFAARSLVSTSTLTIGGHIISSGQAPSIAAGSHVGSSGTVSISGNDASGTIEVNTGTGAGGGTVASVTFRNPYATIPHMAVTAIGANVGSFYVSRNASGFNIVVPGALAPGGYAFDYIVMQ